MNKKEKFAKATRILTTPPVFALVLCTVVFFAARTDFSVTSRYFADVFFLTVLPLAAYPIAFLIYLKRRLRKSWSQVGFQTDDLKNEDEATLRNTERNLAICFSVCGYVCGFITAMLGGSGFERAVFATYLSSAIIIAISNVFGFKISGHASGCSGPIAAAALFISPWFAFGYALIIPIFRSSILLKRHTLLQLLLGLILPIAFLLLYYAIFCIG